MSGPKQHRWSPYDDNGGTCVAVSGEDCAVLIADTRMCKGYNIHSRKGSKVTELTSKCVIGSCGMQADAWALHRLLKAQITMYKHNHRKEPNITSIAQLLSTILYGKRFFPYYTFNVLSGIDDEGVGATYHYDAIGSFERVPYTTSGSGSSLAHSVMDTQIAQDNFAPEHKRKGTLTQLEIADLCQDVMNSTAERDIHTGDGIEIFVINRAGITKQTQALKLD